MAAFTGSRTISLSKMEMVLIQEGLDLLTTVTSRETGPMAEFKKTAVDNTRAHMQTVLNKLERDQREQETRR